MVRRSGRARASLARFGRARCRRGGHSRTRRARYRTPPAPTRGQRARIPCEFSTQAPQREWHRGCSSSQCLPRSTPSDLTSSFSSMDRGGGPLRHGHDLLARRGQRPAPRTRGPRRRPRGRRLSPLVRLRLLRPLPLGMGLGPGLGWLGLPRYVSALRRRLGRHDGRLGASADHPEAGRGVRGRLSRGLGG